MKRSVPPLAFLLPATTLVGAAVAGALVGIEVSLLVVAGGALVGVITLLWASVQSLTGESPLTLEEALSLGAPSAEEEQKRAVLRALKDLEFERSVGKISQEDYVELSNRYRAEARRLMHALDAGGEKDREAIERLLADRIAEQEARRAAKKTETPAPDDEEADSTPSATGPSDPAGSLEPPEEEAESEPRPARKTAEGEGA
jgi:hypothetical protein